MANHLRELSLKENRITDVSSLRNVMYLRNLHLNNNRITDITPLLEGGGISNTINLKGNPPSEVSKGSQLEHLSCIPAYL